MDRTYAMIIAAEIAGTRRAVLELARSTPGLVGINRTKGADSLDAAIDDVVRAVARRLFEGGAREDYAAFLAAAR